MVAPPRKQAATEKTNLVLKSWESPAYSKVRDSMTISRFDHEELRVYPSAIGFVAWLEEAAASITNKVSACGHLARASAGVPVNIAEASGKRSMNERRQ